MYILCQSIEGQTHFGMQRVANKILVLKYGNRLLFFFKFEHYLQACTTSGKK